MTTPAGLEELRGPLTGYCYRMLGSAHDTDDAVQETLLRAHQRLETFDPARGRLTTWVHRIAHNVCVDLLRSAGRRALPIDLGPAAEPGAALPAPLSPECFVQPMPGWRVVHATDPAQRALERESVRLAFVAALQHLTPMQRSAVLLRDVLGFSAAESADILECTTAAANSALQRGRATLADLDLSLDESRPEADEATTDLLRRYVTAFEAHDIDALVALLREDAITSMPPFAWWVRGARAIAELIAVGEHCARDRLVVTDVAGGPGLAQYHPDDTGLLRPFALISVVVRNGLVVETTTHLDAAGRFAEFGLPPALEPGADDFRVWATYKG